MYVICLNWNCTIHELHLRPRRLFPHTSLKSGSKIIDLYWKEEKWAMNLRDCLRCFACNSQRWLYRKRTWRRWKKKLINKHIDGAGGRIMRAWSQVEILISEWKRARKFVGRNVNMRRPRNKKYIRQNIKVQLKSLSSSGKSLYSNQSTHKGKRDDSTQRGFSSLHNFFPFFLSSINEINLCRKIFSFFL